ncbi:molecular chaperone DnaJ [Gammaproteobacteria bacterium]|nr:molecular chaperone DnaJ [Gammaproteobacteria bacterium]
MSKQDFYEVLGVDKSSSSEEIKRAYRKQAMRHHPDRNAGNKDSEQKLKEINEAYAVLSDENKRSQYDNFGHAGAEGFGQGMDFGDINLNDIFEQFFGGGTGGAGGSRSSRGADLAVSLTLSLHEAAHGVEKEVKIRKQAECDDCNGSGGAKGSKPTTCPMCRGSGRVSIQQGFLSIQQTCPKCHGQGQIISNPCRSCKGSGTSNKLSAIKVKIPSGVDNGDRMRVPGKGDMGAHGGPDGDLYIEIQVENHPVFKRDHTDLHCTIPVSFYQACLGGEVEVATLDKMIKLKIPKETQSGSLLRVRGAGIDSRKHNRKGDLICHIQVETPIRLSKAQQELLKTFDEQTQMNQQRPKYESFMQSLKNLFNA